MGTLKKKVAAIGFICFFSLGIFPLSMAVGGPVTSRLLHIHHAKRSQHVDNDFSDGFKPARPDRAMLEKDVLPEEDSELRNPLENASAAKNSAEISLQGLEFFLTSRLTLAGKVSTYIFQSTFNL